MTADVTQDRRVTVLIQGPQHPALSEGSRLFWAKLSPVHERLGFRAIAPDRIQGDAVLPHSSQMAQSRITFRRPASACDMHGHKPSPPDPWRSIGHGLWPCIPPPNQVQSLD